MAEVLCEITRLAAQHALQLRRLIGAANAPVMAETASKDLMLAALAAAEIDLRVTFALVTDDEVESRPVCGSWTLTHLAGHLAEWDALFSYWIGLLRGNPAQALFWDDDGDAFNAYLQERRAGESWEKAWADCRKARTALYEALEQVPDQEFIRLQLPREGVHYPTIYHCAWSALEHYLDHASRVRQELGLPLSPELLHFQGPYT